MISALIYFGIAALFVLPLARWALTDAAGLVYGEPEALDYVITIGLAFVFAAFWPLVVGGFFVYRALKRRGAQPQAKEASR